MAEKLVNEIEAKVVATKNNRRADRIDAYDLGMKLLFQTKEDYERLKKLLGKEDDWFKAVSNSLASELLQCGIDYFKAMKDNSDFSESNSLELLNSAKEVAASIEVKKRIDDNIEGIHDWVKNQVLRDNQNKIYDFNKILLKTAFSFMTCDGKIDANEVALIRKLSEKDNWFGDVDIDTELDFLIEVINTMGMGFLKDYFKVLKNADLSQGQELQLVDMAIKTLYADGRVDYNEIKFFRIFRSILSVSDDQIREKCSDVSEEFLETDIFSHNYLGRLFDDYFEKIEIPVFEKIADKKHDKYVDPEKYSKK
jgi:uncharacterized tellurite resistance protein B-like protein